MRTGGKVCYLRLARLARAIVHIVLKADHSCAGVGVLVAWLVVKRCRVLLVPSVGAFRSHPTDQLCSLGGANLTTFLLHPIRLDLHATETRSGQRFYIYLNKQRIE